MHFGGWGEEIDSAYLDDSDFMDVVNEHKEAHGWLFLKEAYLCSSVHSKIIMFQRSCSKKIQKDDTCEYSMSYGDKLKVWLSLSPPISETEVFHEKPC